MLDRDHIVCAAAGKVAGVTISIAHIEKQNAAATWKKSFGFHPVRREALLIRAEVRDHRRCPCRSRAA
jgi:hypothetical protein